jgi:hypothetical protein
LCGRFRCVSVFRLGAHLTDVSCVVFGRISCGHAFRFIVAPNLGEAVFEAVFVRCIVAPNLQAKICSYPSFSSSFFLVLPCVDVFVADEFFVWVPILRTRLALRLGTQLADVPCIALGRPTCGCAFHLRCGRAFGHPTCGRALRCVEAPKLGEAVLKSLPASVNLFLSILQLNF